MLPRLITDEPGIGFLVSAESLHLIDTWLGTSHQGRVKCPSVHMLLTGLKNVSEYPDGGGIQSPNEVSFVIWVLHPISITPLHVALHRLSHEYQRIVYW